MGIFDRLFAAKPNSLVWGPWQLKLEERKNNFAFFGTTGSGKTLGFILQYANILPRIKPNSKVTQRAVIYDKKGDALSILKSLKKLKLLDPEIQVTLFNPLDSRSHAWDIASEFKAFPKNQVNSHIQRFLNNLFPREQSSKNSGSTFFRNTLIGIGTSILHSLVSSNSHWELADFFQILSNRNWRNELLNSNKMGRQFCLTGSEETQQNVDASIAADIVPFGELAALMKLSADQSRTFTIRDWLTKPSILVFSGPQSDREPLAYLNRTFLTELIQSLSSRPDTTTDFTWFFLDEASSIGHLPAFGTLLQQCRSKGASTFLGIQDISGFQYAVGQRDLAHTILAQITNLAFFLTPDYDTARWGSERCGNRGMIINPQTQRVEPSPRFAPMEFQNLPQFKVGRGLPGIFLTRDRHPKKVSIEPILLDDLKGAGAEPPLGSLLWPEDAVPKQSVVFSELLSQVGAPPSSETEAIHRKSKAKRRGLPTTGRVNPDEAKH